jgi:pimeloyl-ACP methyl ester carboxylesterase
VEGPKLMKEVLESDWTIEKIYATEDWLKTQKTIMLPVEQVDEIVLARISQFKTANQVLALVKKKEYQKSMQFDKELTLVLDGIQDPGNLGTIIRTADWFGVQQIIVSDDTAGLYNPKVIQKIEDMIRTTSVVGYRGTSNALINFDLTSQLNKIKSSVLVIAGEYDQATAISMSEKIVSLLPNAKLLVIKNAAHISSAEQWEFFNKEVIHFLLEN